MSTESHSSPASPRPFRRDAIFVSDPESFFEYEAPTSTSLENRAADGLTERLESGDAPVSTASACGAVGVQADQTHYSGGFALLMPLQQRVAVAVRPARTIKVVSDGQGEIWGPDEENPPPWVTAVHRVLRELLSDRRLDVSVVSTVPAVCRDGALAALGVALIRAVRSLDVQTTVALDDVQSLRDEVVPFLATAFGAAIERPYSTAYPLASFAGSDTPFTLVDTTTREHLPVETDARDELAWAIFDPGIPESDSVHFHARRQQQADEALRRLRENGFETVAAFRDLNYRALESALKVLSDDLRPVVRHLVTENHRVQKHVAAMRRRDWQMIGGLLLMSHSSHRDQWKGTSPGADAIVAAAETRTHDGLYGACMTGRSGAVLVTGRRQGFDAGLRHLTESARPVIGQSPRIFAP